MAKGHVIAMASPPSPKPEPLSRAGRTQPQRRPASRLDAAMACDTAFRIVARRGLKDLTAHHAAACAGDADAVHDMRVAITRLRTATSFFSPMVAGPQRTRIRNELKWVNAHLGAVRDLDVAIERLKKIDKQAPPADYPSWNSERTASQRRLARVLQSARYRRLIKSVSDWVERGSWSTRAGRQAATQRTRPIAEYSARKLTRWRKKLIKKSRNLRGLGTRKLHRLRLLNKKLHYAILSVADLISNNQISKQRATMKFLRQAQKSLGQLNDDAMGRSLAASMGKGGAQASQPFLSPKREKRQMRSAAMAYKKLAELTPLRI
jgi:CHAD domain-containing protein